jgi:hypothetical protein
VQYGKCLSHDLTPLVDTSASASRNERHSY